jgi:V8-like Glu-specific endopeptidase
MGAPRVSAALVAGVLAGAVLSGVAPTSAGADGATATATIGSRHGDVVAAPRALLSARNVRRYWTPARMAAAVPIEDVLSSLKVPGADADAGQEPTSRTAAGRVRAPRTTGKLFFSDDSADFVCSAAAIRTKKRNQVITAGHCVHSGPHPEGGLFPPPPHFFSNWVFVPRYRNGHAPFGKWVANNAYAFDGWIEHEAFRYDQAILSFRKRNGRRLVNAIGGNEVVWGNDQRQRGTTIWGWPAEDPYDGEVARSCTGRTTPFEGSADAAMHACDLNGGASGGPWFLPHGRKGHTGRIWAVTSRRINLRPVLLARPIPRQIRQMIRAANR